MKLLLVLSAIVLAVNSLPVNENGGKNWVVLVAGSNTWWNYRHQADIYHAYQIVKANGIPDENIIVFHYDDIANNKQNKYPGKVFNNPDHKDVYHGVPKDYTGDDVTPTNFLKVLLGDKDLESSGKKVLNSGPNDNVFVFFDDHGAVDLVAFPKTYLYGENLTSTLKEMHTQKKYSKLVFYIEACEAGSMFEKLLPTDINIYATTASSPNESSYAWYDDTELGTYLGDEYSIHWMEEAEQATDTTTLEDQFQWTKTKTTKSHVQHYGDLSIAKLPLSQFLGKRKSATPVTRSNSRTAVDNKDVPLAMAKGEDLENLVKGRQFLDTHFATYVNSVEHLVNGDVLNTRSELNNRECYHKFVDTFHDQCMNIAQNSYVLGKLQTFVNICEQSSPAGAEAALTQLVSYCQQNMAYPAYII